MILKNSGYGPIPTQVHSPSTLSDWFSCCLGRIHRCSPSRKLGTAGDLLHLSLFFFWRTVNAIPTPDHISTMSNSFYSAGGTGMTASYIVINAHTDPSNSMQKNKKKIWLIHVLNTMHGAVILHRMTATYAVEREFLYPPWPEPKPVVRNRTGLDGTYLPPMFTCTILSMNNDISTFRAYFE